MGLFNFFYKLTNILSNKRKLRVFVIIVLIFIILFCWSMGAFASTPEDDEAILAYQLTLQESAIAYMKFIYEHKGASTSGYDSTAFTNILKRMRDYQMYVAVPTGDPNCSFWIYFYTAVSGSNNPNLFTTQGVYSVGLNSGTQINCMLGNISASYVSRLVQPYTGNTTPDLGSSSSVLMPSAAYCVRSSAVNEFLDQMGVYANIPTTLKTRDAELQTITRNGFANELNAINNVNSTMEDVNSNVQDVNQSVNEMIETIVAPYVNVSQEQLPTQEVNDTSTEPLNTLFDYIKDAFTGEPTGFSLPLPFVRW